MKNRQQSIALVTLICLSMLLPWRAAADTATPQLRASGEAEVSMAPDMAVVELTVTREAETARAALDANSAAMAAVIEGMRAGGVAERDLQTANFSIQPRYVYPKPRDEKPPRIVAYTVRNSLTVRVRDLADLGQLLDKSVSLGVNEGGGVSFANADPGPALAEARAAAVKDALAKIRTLASAAGVSPGDILEISEQRGAASPVHYKAERVMMAAADAVPIASGENSYRVVVQVSVAINQ